MCSRLTLVKLEVFVKIGRPKLDFKVSDEVASRRASGMIYTPCLGPKGSALAKTSKDVAGNTMLGKLVAFPESCPWGLWRGVWGPIFSLFDWIFS
jgi:hypothetical protein